MPATLRAVRLLGPSLLLLASSAFAGVTTSPTATAAGPPPQAVETARLDAFVAGQLGRADVPGVAYAIVGPDGVQHRATYGVDGNGTPISAATPFLWGSLAKPVTATLVELMAETGELSLDDPVVAHLPGFRTAERRASDRITVRHLLTQTSGLPARLDLTDRYQPDRRARDVVPALAHVELAADVGTEHIYSSVNYLLLSAVVEAVTGRELADVLAGRVLEPLGMHDAIASPAQASAVLPPGHRYVLGRPAPFRVAIDPAGVGYGYLGGSLDDLAKFAAAHLSNGPLLTQEQRRELHRAAVRTDADRSYGLGWRTWQVFGVDAPMIWHSGAAPGYQSSVVLLPDLDKAVVVLQNAYGSFQEGQLLDTAWGLASMLSGGEPVRHGTDRLYPLILTVLALIALSLLVAVATSTRALVRPGLGDVDARSTVVRLVGWLTGTGFVAAALAHLPGVFGVGMSQVVLWAPDIAYLLVVGLSLIVILVPLRMALAARSMLVRGSRPRDGLPSRGRRPRGRPAG